MTPPTEESKGQFAEYALVEIMGHQSVAGYVTTMAFGATVMFHVTAPEEIGPEETLTTRTYVNGEYLLPGSKIRRKRLGVDELIGSASVYRMRMCSAQTAQEHQKLVTEILERAEVPQLEAPDASEKASKINVELLYDKLHNDQLDLSDYDQGVVDALGWVLEREPRPQLDVDIESGNEEGLEEVDEETGAQF